MQTFRGCEPCSLSSQANFPDLDAGFAVAFDRVASGSRNRSRLDRRAAPVFQIVRK